MNKIKKGSLDNKMWEGVGDSIIRVVIFENIHRLPARINGETYFSYLNSNKHFYSIRNSLKFPMRFKRENTSMIGSKNYYSNFGDEVEYYVAFLYFNYGIDSARRYILKNILSKYLIE